jgi:predicted amidohydrolase
MTELRVGCAQFAASPGDMAANAARIARMTAEAKADGCALVVFPEMIASGYLAPEAVKPLAAPLDAAPVRIVSPAGAVAAVYRKMHLWGAEADWAAPGDDVPVAEVAGARVSGWICFDTRFPELARLAALRGAELAVVPTAWLGPAEEWELSLRARALDNSLFVAGADIIDPGIGCRGHSMIVDPGGRVLARAKPGEEGVVSAQLDPHVRAAQIGRLHLLEARRPARYRGLTA